MVAVKHKNILLTNLEACFICLISKVVLINTLTQQ
jgi:hypothetical protein